MYGFIYVFFIYQYMYVKTYQLLVAFTAFIVGLYACILYLCPD